VSPIVDVVAPRLLGPAIVLAAAIIVRGYSDVGDGFSAAVIVALAIALRYLTLGPERAERSLPMLRQAPAIAIAGLLMALSAGFFGVPFGNPPFTHWPPPGEPVVTIGRLEIMTAVVFDLGLFLLVTGVLAVLIHHLSHTARSARGSGE